MSEVKRNSIESLLSCKWVALPTEFTYDNCDNLDEEGWDWVISTPEERMEFRDYGYHRNNEVICRLESKLLADYIVEIHSQNLSIGNSVFKRNLYPVQELPEAIRKQIIEDNREPVYIKNEDEDLPVSERMETDEEVIEMLKGCFYDSKGILGDVIEVTDKNE